MSEPDYENDLAFKPAMSFEELSKIAWENGGTEFYDIYTGSQNFSYRGLKYYDLGLIKTFDGTVIAKEKTPDQMYEIMKLLEN